MCDWARVCCAGLGIWDSLRDLIDWRQPKNAFQRSQNFYNIVEYLLAASWILLLGFLLFRMQLVSLGKGEGGTGCWLNGPNGRVALLCSVGLRRFQCQLHFVAHIFALFQIAQINSVRLHFVVVSKISFRLQRLAPPSWFISHSGHWLNLFSQICFKGSIWQFLLLWGEN